MSPLNYSIHVSPLGHGYIRVLNAARTLMLVLVSASDMPNTTPNFNFNFGIFHACIYMRASISERQESSLEQRASQLPEV